MSALVLENLFWLCLAAFLVANLKNLFGAWHLRIFYILFNHFRLHRSRHVDVSKDGFQAIFQPIITSCHSPLLECDYNLHKSNSTYFTDLDVNHTHLVSSLFKDVLSSSSRKGKTGNEGKSLTIALGGVACTFKREIKPYEKYEVWTRVLCWDEKWLYVVSHFVKPGVLKRIRCTPEELARQGVERTWAEKRNETRKGMLRYQPLGLEEDWKKMIFASSMAKYVFKRGRITVSPRIALECSRLLPSTSSVLNDHTPLDKPANLGKDTVSKVDELSSSEGKWTLAQVEEENFEGLKIAAHFAELVGVHDTFAGASSLIRGQF